MTLLRLSYARSLGNAVAAYISVTNTLGNSASRTVRTRPWLGQAPDHEAVRSRETHYPAAGATRRDALHVTPSTRQPTHRLGR
jgi:hypothetical protein